MLNTKIVSLSSEGYLVLDTMENILDVNDSYCKMVGYTKEEIMGFKLLDLEIEEGIQISSVIKNLEKNSKVNFETIHKTKDRQKLYLKCTAEKFDISNEVYIILLLTDISDYVKLKNELENTIKKLEENEKLLNITNEIANVGGWEINLKTNTLTWTKQIYKMHEVDEGYIPTVENAIKFYDINSLPIIKKALENAMEFGIPFDVELKIITARGKSKDVRAIGYVKRDKDDFNEYVYGTFQDITLKKISEDKLLKSEQELRRAQEIAHLGSWYLDVETNEVTWSVELYKMYGFDPTKPVPPYTEHMKLFTSKSWEVLSSSLQKTRELGIPYELELETIKEDLSNGWMWVHGEAIRNNEGKIIGLWGAAQDITDKKNREIELIKSKELVIEEKERLNFVLEGSKLGFWDWNIETNEVQRNERWAEILGYTLEEINTTVNQWSDFIYVEDRERALKSIQDHIDGKTPYHQLEYRMYTKDGELRWILDSAKVVKRNQEGKAQRMSGTHLDITDKKKHEELITKSKEEAEKASKAKSDFLSNMSHELRTPLNGIVGFVDILYSIEESKEKREYLDIIKESSDHLLELINDILSLSKIEANMYKIDKEKVNLYEKVNLLIKTYKKQVEMKNLVFKFYISYELDKVILINYSSILKILNNLLSNAIKFTKCGYISIRVENVDKTVLEITVEDTGIGINEEKQKHLFEAFEQGEYHLTKEYGGTGLGLALVKQLVDLLKGRISVITKVGKGTKIVIQIPYDDLIEDIEVDSEDFNNTLVDKELRIISAEDIETNQRLLELSLANQCKVFKKVYNGKELLEELEVNDYDLILMDVQMPLINGLDATRIIKNNPKCLNIPIIAVSAYALDEDIKKMYQVGIKNYISKPIKKEELVAKINEIIRLKW